MNFNLADGFKDQFVESKHKKSKTDVLGQDLMSGGFVKQTAQNCTGFQHNRKKVDTQV